VGENNASPTEKAGATVEKGEKKRKRKKKGGKGGGLGPLIHVCLRPVNPKKKKKRGKEGEGGGRLSGAGPRGMHGYIW